MATYGSKQLESCKAVSKFALRSMGGGSMAK